MSDQSVSVHRSNSLNGSREDVGTIFEIWASRGIWRWERDHREQKRNRNILRYKHSVWGGVVNVANMILRSMYCMWVFFCSNGATHVSAASIPAWNVACVHVAGLARLNICAQRTARGMRHR